MATNNEEDISPDLTAFERLYARQLNLESKLVTLVDEIDGTDTTSSINDQVRNLVFKYLDSAVTDDSIKVTDYFKGNLCHKTYKDCLF